MEEGAEETVKEDSVSLEGSVVRHDEDAITENISYWILASMPHAELSPETKFPFNEKLQNEEHLSWPPTSKSIWGNEMLARTVVREQILRYRLQESATGPWSVRFLPRGSYAREEVVGEGDSISLSSHSRSASSKRG